MAKHDMVWNKLPRNWKESPFIGNGEQGSMIYQTGKDVMHWSVGCSAAHDHRPHAEDDFKEKNVPVLNRGRHFIGHLELKTGSEIKNGTARLHLWDAEARGTITTSSGEVTWRALTHAAEPVTFIEIKGGKALKAMKFSYTAALAQSPRAVRSKNPRKPANPSPKVSKLPDGVQTAVFHPALDQCAAQLS